METIDSDNQPILSNETKRKLGVRHKRSQATPGKYMRATEASVRRNVTYTPQGYAALKRFKEALASSSGKRVSDNIALDTLLSNLSVFMQKDG